MAHSRGPPVSSRRAANVGQDVVRGDPNRPRYPFEPESVWYGRALNEERMQSSGKRQTLYLVKRIIRTTKIVEGAGSVIITLYNFVLFAWEQGRSVSKCSVDLEFDCGGAPQSFGIIRCLPPSVICGSMNVLSSESAPSLPPQYKDTSAV